jgi:hypothetical protein
MQIRSISQKKVLYICIKYKNKCSVFNNALTEYNELQNVRRE